MPRLTGRRLKPPPTLTVSEWADTFRKLSPEASAEPGQWSTARAPYQRGMMDALSSPGVEMVVVMTSAQVGKTELINNAVGYLIDQDPGPTLVLQPTIAMGEAWSKDRLAPMLRDTPTLNGKVGDRRAKDSENTILHKTFPGGHITVAGANSPASLASRPIRWLFADEVDRYPVSAGAEGDPLALAQKRTTTFHNRKVLVVSTPTVKGASRIESAFSVSDQQYFFVPCPHCGHFQRLEWRGLKWEKDKPETAAYSCEDCSGKIADSHKPAMLSAGEWRPTNEGSPRVRGFHLNELYSPWVRFSEIVEAFLEAKQSPETLKTWVNTALGETWEEDGEQVDPTALSSRREGFTRPPEGALVLTAGVDVQDDRLEALAVAWGEGLESWFFDLRIFYGDPGRAEVWDELEDYLSEIREGADGSKFRILSACIDSGGHFTDAVYKFTGPRRHRRIFATKGVGGMGRPIIGRPSKANKGKVPLFPVGVDTAKELLLSRLKIQAPGAGYIHFSKALDDEFFDQLTAEKRVERKVRGVVTYEWRKVRRRNEALDLAVLNLAALEILNPNLAALARKRGTVDDGPDDDDSPPPTEKAPRAQRKPKTRRSRGGFVNGWR